VLPQALTHGPAARQENARTGGEMQRQWLHQQIKGTRMVCSAGAAGHQRRQRKKKGERIRPWAWIEETDWVLSNGGTRISYHAPVPFPSVWQWVDAHATHQVSFCRLSSENWRSPGSNP
jgi:hypothetical protein